jgi:rRNA-processing protein FCF1
MAIDWLWGDKVNTNSQPSNNAPNSGKRLNVILDTNALLMIFQFKLNLESELDRLLGSYNIIIPSGVVAELEKLVSSVPEAQAALRLSERYNIIELGTDPALPEKSSDRIDLAIVAMAERLNAIVVTNDKQLRTNLKTKNLKTIYLKSKSHLELD